MVTYIDTKNREKYQVLFSKAERVLTEAANNGDLLDGIATYVKTSDTEIVTDKTYYIRSGSTAPYTYTAVAEPVVNDLNNYYEPSLEITTLNQYFAYLQDLISVSSNENIRSYFLRLPLDEDLFEINANTRVITIPSSFNRNGVGVQGDETAEIIYFSIDRYFDHMDLASEDMNIVIQWETRNANRETITGISPNFGKDIETIPGKIIFGWPIYSELTESATPIRFAVRFFSLGETSDENNLRTLTYSLATLPAEISVGATIDYDLVNKTVQKIDKGNMIINRIKNVGIYDPSTPAPSAPIISTPLYVVGGEDGVKVADLPAEEGGKVTLQVGARPADFGAIQYDWRKFSYNQTTGEYETNSDPLTTDVNNGIYEEVTTIGDDIYYKLTTTNAGIVYEPVVIDDILGEDREYKSDEETEEGLGFELEGGGYVKLYKRLSQVKVDSVGIYTVNVSARAGVNTVATTMDRADGIKIPGPLKPTIEDNVNDGYDADQKTIHVIVGDSGEVTLTVVARKSETDENAQVTLSYDWQEIDGVNNTSIDQKDEDDDYSFSSSGNEMTITNLATSGLDKSYIAEVTATRNTVSTAAKSAVYRLTNAPEKPEIKVYIGGRSTVADYSTQSGALPINKKRKGAFNTINFSITPIAHSDALSYLWMRMNFDEGMATDWDGQSTKLQIDLDGFLADLFENKPGAADYPMTDDGTFKLTALENLGEIVEGQDNGPALTLSDATPAGYYYCIVINELNGHRVANVTPFFQVIDNS